MAQGVNSPDGVNMLNANKDVDIRKQPIYESKAALLAALPVSKRAEGLKMDYKENGEWKTGRFEGGTANANFVEVQMGGDAEKNNYYDVLYFTTVSGIANISGLEEKYYLIQDTTNSNVYFVSKIDAAEDFYSARLYFPFDPETGYDIEPQGQTVDEQDGYHIWNSGPIQSARVDELVEDTAYPFDLWRRQVKDDLITVKGKISDGTDTPYTTCLELQQAGYTLADDCAMGTEVYLDRLTTGIEGGTEHIIYRKASDDDNDWKVWKNSTGMWQQLPIS